MQRNSIRRDELHQLAYSYALGALDATASEAFEEHLRGCEACQVEVRSLGEATGVLAASVAATPPPSLRDRLLSRVRSFPQRPGILFEQQGLLIARSEELAWQTLAEGITFKPLYIDEARRYNTCLVHMEAGAHYPPHRHKETEELFMLSGDLHVAGEIMHAGDYCRANADTVHDETFSESGCLFLLLASQENEVLS